MIVVVDDRGAAHVDHRGAAHVDEIIVERGPDASVRAATGHGFRRGLGAPDIRSIGVDTRGEADGVKHLVHDGGFEIEGPGVDGVAQIPGVAKIDGQLAVCADAVSVDRTVGENFWPTIPCR